MRRLALHLLPLVVLAVFAVAACTATESQGPVDSGNAPTPGAASSGGGGAGVCATAAAGATATVTVEYKDFKPSPDPVTAKVGDVIGWTNGDSAPHTATLDDGSCSTDNISQGATGLLVFNKAGSYTYHCKIHSSMKDFKITVTE
jgi:plastocyanin